MRLADITARVRRLDQLSRGIARELQIASKVDLLQYRERRDYFDAMRRVWVGLENARAALAKARRRIERGKAGQQ